VYEEPVKPSSDGRFRSGGVNQTFHAPVTMNQAIATDNAIQKVEQVGNKTGSSLKKIADLIQKSQELTPRQVKEGLAYIEALAMEEAKPEDKRNWKSLLESGKAILEITDKATDLAKKFAPYTPVIITLIDQAKHFIR
jgi:hypothetical protein